MPEVDGPSLHGELLVLPEPTAVAILGLPRELLDKVIDDLQDEYGDLRSVSLVCRAFAPRAQKHLHRRVHLVCDMMKLERATDVYSSATLSAYGQELEIDLPPRSECEHVTLAALTLIFASVPHLVLHGTRRDDEFNECYSFLNNFRDTQTLVLDSFAPQRLAVLHEMFRCFSTITTFYIRNPKWPARAGDRESHPEHNLASLPQRREVLPRLDNLHVIVDPFLVDLEHILLCLTDIMGPGVCTTLRSCVGQLASINKVLRLFGTALQHLELGFPPSRAGKHYSRVTLIYRHLTGTSLVQVISSIQVIPSQVFAYSSTRRFAPYISRASIRTPCRA